MASRLCKFLSENETDTVCYYRRIITAQNVRQIRLGAICLGVCDIRKNKIGGNTRKEVKNPSAGESKLKIKEQMAVLDTVAHHHYAFPKLRMLKIQYPSLIISFRKLMFGLVQLYHVSFVYVTTMHGRAILLCMNVLLHDKMAAECKS